MIADYKVFAKELYTIKLAVVGSTAIEKNTQALQTYLEKLNDLRPKFRHELNGLAQEFLSGLVNPTERMVEEIREINTVYIRKLHAHANYIRREMRLLAS